MTSRDRCLLALAFALAAPIAGAAEIALLSGGAVEPGVKPAIAAFEAATGHRVKVTFNTAPAINKRLEAGESWDVVIAPVSLVDAAAKAGRVGADRAAVGRVGIGVAIGPDAPVPAIGTADTLKQSLLEAEKVISNRASTGVAFEGVLKRMDIASQVEPRSIRMADGAGVMEHLLASKGREIGVGAITEILLYRDRGLRFVGPLPAPLQVYTVYAATIPATATQGDAARQLLAYLGGTQARGLFAAAGVEAAP